MDAALRSLRDAVLAVDQTGRPLFANAAFDRLFGEPGALRHLHDEGERPLPPDHLPHRRAARGETFDAVLGMRAGDAPTRWFAVRGEPLVGADGGVQGGLLALRDITARRQRHADTHTIRQAFAIAAVGLAVLDLAGRYLHANGAYCALLGRGEAELRTTDCLAFAPAAQREHYRESMQRLRSGALPDTMIEQQGISEEGVSVSVAGRLVLARDSAGQPGTLVLTMQDSTPRTIQQARREFGATISHDLRTPLTVLQAGLEMLSSSADARLRPEEHALLENLERNTLRLKERIDDLLALHQIRLVATQHEADVLDLRAAIATALAPIRRLLARREQTVALDLGELLPVVGDRGQLERALSSVLYAVHSGSPPRAHLRIQGRQIGGMIQVEIATSGSATSLAQQEAGLKLARGIIELHGGNLRAAETAVGATGGAFTITMPCANGDAIAELMSTLTEDGGWQRDY